MKTLRLRESSTLQCGVIDEATPVIPRVKILGWDSTNRRKYLYESVELKDYEGISVNLNHPEGRHQSRAVQERFGWFANVTKDESGVWGDLHYNPELPYAKAFAWWAKHKPDKIGMSHDAIGQGITKGDIFEVHKARPRAVDLVADPATTKGLYESMNPELGDDVPDSEEGLDDLQTHIKNAISAIVDDDAMDVKAKERKIKKALKLLEDPPEEEDEEGDEEGEKSEKKDDEEEEEEEDDDKKNAKESVRPRKRAEGDTVKALRERVDILEAQLAVEASNRAATEREKLVAKLLEQAKFPKNAVSDFFKAQLFEAADEKTIKTLIEDRRRVLGVERPRSSGPSGATANLDLKEYAKRITG